LEVDMTDRSAAFFERLAQRGHAPELEEVEATIRFDLVGAQGTDYWAVEINRGDVRVSREPLAAECIVHTDHAVANQIVTGELQAQPAWLRRLLWVEGNLVLLRLFERAFPGPPNAHDPRDLIRRDGQPR
jgi:SCP-2 sterol transfer family